MIQFYENLCPVVGVLAVDGSSNGAVLNLLSYVDVVWNKEAIRWCVVADQLQMVPKRARLFLPHDTDLDPLTASGGKESTNWIDEF